MLFSKDSTNQTDNSVTIGEDTYDVGAPADFSISRSVGLLDQTFFHTDFGALANANNSSKAFSR